MSSPKRPPSLALLPLLLLLLLALVRPLNALELRITSGIAGQSFGEQASVSVSGHHIGVGKKYDNQDRGAVYLFTCDFVAGSGCSEFAKLTASDGAPSTYFGSIVSLDGDRLAATAYDPKTWKVVAYVFTCDFGPGGGCTQFAKIGASDAAVGDGFPSLTMSGDKIAVGANGHENHKGAAYVFACDFGVGVGAAGGGCTQFAKVQASDGVSGDEFGYSVTLSGNKMAVGAPYHASRIGAVYLYTCDFGAGSGCTQFAKVASPTQATYAYFGNSVSVAGDKLAVGAIQTQGQGRVYIYACDFGVAGSNCSGLATLLPPGAPTFGHFVSVLGDMVAVTSRDTRRVYLFSCNFGAGDGCALTADFGPDLPCRAMSLSNHSIAIGHCSDGRAHIFGPEVPCPSRMVKHGYQCLQACPDGFFNDGGSCQGCPSECATCLSSQVCTKCLADYGLLNGTCLLDCGSGFRKDLGLRICLDLCSPNPCNGGQCEGAGPDRYLCDCSGTGFEGPQCQRDIDDCASQPCQHGGVCRDTGSNSFSCNCMGTGYHGLLCELDVDDCAFQPCQNGGVCQDTGANSYLCDCSGTGFEGPQCQRDIDDCASQPCQHGGVCQDTGADSYLCDCSGTGFEGPQCQMDINDCASQPCQNGGICQDTGVDSYLCDCSGTGFEGPQCQSDVDDCRPNPCLHGGRCTDEGANSYSCDCSLTGHEGLHCEADMNDCASQPCQNGGVCQDLGANQYYCDCSQTGLGGPQCQIDFCAGLLVDCPEGTRCRNSRDTYLCEPRGSQGESASSSGSRALIISLCCLLAAFIVAVVVLTLLLLRSRLARAKSQEGEKVLVTLTEVPTAPDISALEKGVRRPSVSGGSTTSTLDAPPTYEMTF